MTLVSESYLTFEDFKRLCKLRLELPPNEHACNRLKDLLEEFQLSFRFYSNASSWVYEQTSLYQSKRLCLIYDTECRGIVEHTAQKVSEMEIRLFEIRPDVQLSFDEEDFGIILIGSNSQYHFKAIQKLIERVGGSSVILSLKEALSEVLPTVQGYDDFKNQELLTLLLGECLESFINPKEEVDYDSRKADWFQFTDSRIEEMVLIAQKVAACKGVINVKLSEAYNLEQVISHFKEFPFRIVNANFPLGGRDLELIIMNPDELEEDREELNFIDSEIQQIVINPLQDDPLLVQTNFRIRIILYLVFRIALAFKKQEFGTIIQKKDYLKIKNVFDKIFYSGKFKGNESDLYAIVCRAYFLQQTQRTDEMVYAIALRIIANEQTP